MVRGKSGKIRDGRDLLPYSVIDTVRVAPSTIWTTGSHAHSSCFPEMRLFFVFFFAALTLSTRVVVRLRSCPWGRCPPHACPSWWCAQAPPRTLIGKFALDKNTGTGDLLQLRDKIWQVRRVTYRHRYTDGRFVMFSKSADATETSRAITESFLERALENPAPPDSELRLDDGDGGGGEAQ